MEEKTKKILNGCWKIFYLFFVMPSILALVCTVGFLSLYFLLTHPMLAEYQNQLSFKFGTLNVAFGLLWTQVIIIYKSLEYVGIK